MQPFLIDFRQAGRSLRKAPGLTAVAIVSLAVGIGANVTVFSVVREMILDDLSAQRPNRLARVEGIDVSYTLYRQLRTAGAFDDLAFYRNFGDRIWSAGDRSEIVWRLTTSANFFDVLGIRAYAGRLYSQADEGRELAVASYGFWRKRLHSNPNMLGQPIQLAGKLYTLVGVLPRDYRSIYGHGLAPELYLSDAGSTDPHDRLYGLFGRLHSSASWEQTRQSFAAGAERLKAPDPVRRIVVLRPMSELRANAAKGGDDRLFLLFFVTLFGVAGMLSLIGCSNVAGLLMVRTMNRQRELAIRKALGATRVQILRPLLAEGLVLVLSGAGLGLALDVFLRERLRDLHWPSAYGIPFEFHFQSDSGLFLYAGVAAVTALLLSSVLPAVRGADADLGLAMKQTEPSFSVRRWDIRNGFVILQVVLSMVLLILSSLFMRSLLYLTAAGPGFDATHTLIAVMHPLPGRYDGERSSDLRRQALQHIESVPGVESVTSAGMLPLMGEVPGDMLRRQGDSPSALRKVYVIGAGEDYFQTLKIPILRGRDFNLADRGRTPIPVIVNRTLVRDVFAGTDPIGQYLVIGREKERVLEIVGVAADFKMRTLGEASVPAVFTPDFNAAILRSRSGESSVLDGTAAKGARRGGRNRCARCATAGGGSRRSHVPHARGSGIPGLAQRSRTRAIVDRFVRICFLCGRAANAGIWNSLRAGRLAT